MNKCYSVTILSLLLSSEYRPDFTGGVLSNRQACANMQTQIRRRIRFDHEIFSTVILSLPLIQEGQVSISGERMCTILVNRLEDYACPVNVWLGKLVALDMTLLG